MSKKLMLPKGVLFYILIVFAVYLLTVSFNWGFVASDEYWSAMVRYLPAQTATVDKLVTPEDVKSPLQIYPMYLVAQTAYALGVEHPFLQFHWVIIFFGLTGAALSIGAFYWLYKNKIFLQTENQFKLALLLYGFHFAVPGILTRPMFETLASPWILWLAAAALIYNSKKDKTSLIVGVIAGSMSFLLRQQAGVCALIMIILPLVHRRNKDLFLAMGLGAVIFILLGIPDYFLRGEFHFSLRAITRYNIDHGREYIDQPWYFYFPLIFIFMFGPWMLTSKVWNHLKQNFKLEYPLYLILALFLILHIGFPNKWERFLFSMFPLMLLMLTSLFWPLLNSWQEHRWRLGSLLVFNFMIWGLVTFSPAQKNIIEMARYLDQNPQIKTIYSLADTFVWIPDVFIRKPAYGVKRVELPDLISLESQLNCSSGILVKEGNIKDLPLSFEKRKRVRFDVNLVEGLSYRLNPGPNQKRTPLVLFLADGC